ncbi:MAG: tryptophan synthase subunit alpha [Halioglobus sp.]
MSRIEGRFKQLAAEGRKAVIPYLVAGDPHPGYTVALMHALVEAGADIIELGVPFSDPMAEGQVIQLAHERALEHKTSLRMALDFVRGFRESDQNTPVLLMGYANPVEHMGYAVFADAAAAAGLDGLLTVDIPPEEVGPINIELSRVGLDNIFLVAPTTPDDRIELITRQASGFVYYVSLKGVTGAGHLDTAEVGRQVEAIRRHTDLPVAVGFGIKDAESAERVAKSADGVVVGSALVQKIADAVAADDSVESAIGAAKSLLADIRRGVDNTAS